MAAGPGTIEKRYVRVPIAGKCVKFPYILKIFDIGRMEKLKKIMEQLSKKGDWLLLPEHTTVADAIRRCSKITADTEQFWYFGLFPGFGVIISPDVKELEEDVLFTQTRCGG